MENWEAPITFGKDSLGQRFVLKVVAVDEHVDDMMSEHVKKCNNVKNWYPFDLAKFRADTQFLASMKIRIVE